MDVVERHGWRALVALAALALAVELFAPFGGGESRAQLPAERLTLWYVERQDAGIARLAATAIRADDPSAHVAVRRQRGGPAALRRFAEAHAGNPAHLLLLDADRPVWSRAPAVAVLAQDRIAVAAHPSIAGRTLGEIYGRLRAGDRLTVAVPRDGALERLVVQGMARAAGAPRARVRVRAVRAPGRTVLAGRADVAVDGLAALRPGVARGRLGLLAVTRGGQVTVRGRSQPMFASTARLPELELRRALVALAPAGVPEGARTALAAVVSRALESSDGWWRGLAARRLEPADVAPSDAEAAFLRDQTSLRALRARCGPICSRQR